MENQQHQSPDRAQSFTWGKPLNLSAATVIADGPRATLLDAVMQHHGRIALTASTLGARVLVTQFRGDIEVTRTFLVPLCGIVIPIGTGRVRISALLEANSLTDCVLNGGVAYGRPVSEWTIDEDVTLAALATVQVKRPAWARRASVVVLTGALTVPAWAASAATAVVSASGDLTLTAGAGGALVSVSWELFT